MENEFDHKKLIDLGFISDVVLPHHYYIPNFSISVLWQIGDGTYQARKDLHLWEAMNVIDATIEYYKFKTIDEAIPHLLYLQKRFKELSAEIKKRAIEHEFR